jgi:protein TonB
LKYPEIDESTGVEGIVVVKFVIDKKGKLTNAEITRSVDPALDEEVLRVVNLSPKWTPGKQRGILVKVSFEFHVKFKLSYS